MSKLRAILLFTALVTLVFGIDAFAASGKKFGPDTGTVSFSHLTGTPTQRAVFAAFLARIPGPAGSASRFDSAISVSNILAVPFPAPAAVTGGLSDVFDTFRASLDRRGTIEFFLFNQNGEFINHVTAAGSPGAGLNADGTLSPGRTYTVLLEDILAAATGNPLKQFIGYGWVIANFDAVAGSYNNTSFGVGFTQAFELLPGMGQGGFLGGLPVSVPAGSRLATGSIVPEP